MSTQATAPSAHLLTHRDALLDTAGLGPTVDLACGRGRHTLAAAELGLCAIGIDRNTTFLDDLAGAARARGVSPSCVRANLETEYGIPLTPGSCGAILVFRFLFRPLARAIVETLAPGGLLLYETFTVQQLELSGGARRRAFLLEADELPALFPELDVIFYRERVSDVALASLAARKR